jgi:hypothetical protein
MPKRKFNSRALRQLAKEFIQTFADHLRHVGRVYPRDQFGRVVLLIDCSPRERDFCNASLLLFVGVHSSRQC